MLEDIQNELQAILGKYPEVLELKFCLNKSYKWTIIYLVDLYECYKHCNTLAQAIEHLETKYPNR